jgi:hypothetical protein
MRLYETTKSASVKRVLLSSATNTTQHTNSKTEQNTNIKCGKGGITRIIYRKLTDHANYLVTSLARKKQIQICFRWSVSVVLVAEERRTRFTEADFVVFTPHRL